MAIENRGPQVEAVAILFLTLSWIAVGLRCYVKLFMTKLFKIDDWLAVASLISFTFFCAVIYAGSRDGIGRHVYDLSKEQFSRAMIWWYCAEISYVITTAIIKDTIGCFLLQICVNRYQKIAIWIVLIMVTVFSIAEVMVLVFQCSPVSNFWTRFLGEPGTCISGRIIADLAFCHAAIITFSDWTLGIVPIFLVWNLKMNSRTKVSVAVILGLGSVGCVASIVRFPYLYLLTETEDFLWANRNNAIWSTVEGGVGVVASSMATLRPLFKAFLSRTRSANGTYPWNGSRRGYFTKKTNNDLELRPNFSKSIQVTTTIVNSESTRVKKHENDFKKSSDSERDLKEGSKWSANLETESIENVGHGIFIEGGRAV